MVRVEVQREFADTLEALVSDQTASHGLRHVVDMTPESRRGKYGLPLFDIRLFKKLDFVDTYESVERVWQSSGTGGSVSRVPLKTVEFYDEAISLCLEGTQFESALFGVDEILTLVPSSKQWPSSSLAYMFDKITENFGLPSTSIVRVDGDRPESVSLNESTEEPTVPVAIFTTSYMGIKFCQDLLSKGTLWNLPEGSCIVDTGGYKGVVRDYSRDEFKRYVQAALGIRPEMIFSEYGMSELSSQMWSEYINGEEWWLVPDSMDVEILDEDGDGVGQVAIYDVLNVWGLSSILTQDKGRVKTIDGKTYFRPEGRLPKAESKGCSLVAERTYDA